MTSWTARKARPFQSLGDMGGIGQEVQGSDLSADRFSLTRLRAITLRNDIHILTLRVGDQKYDTPERKAQVLRETLLPLLPEADLSDISDHRYPEPIQMPAMTEQEVHRAVLRAGPNKAPGPDSIPNIALHHALAGWPSQSS